MKEFIFNLGGLLSDLGDLLFTWCVEAMKYFSEISGMSYEMINILLFVILGPLSTICFLISTILAYKEKKKAALIVGIIGGIIVLSVLGVSAYSLFTCPFFLYS